MYSQLKSEDDQLQTADDESIDSSITTEDSSRCSSWSILLAFLLVLSIIYNIIAFIDRRASVDSIKAFPSTKGYVGLTNTITIPLAHDNRTLYDEVWSSSRYDEYAGMIAMDDDFVRKHNILPAQAYPWDRSKSIYLLHGFHSLHCVLLLRDTIIEASEHREWTWTMGHVTHCLHVLREDIECYADDFVRYTGAVNAEMGKTVTTSGVGATRTCRDWDQLKAFAQENSACYRRQKPTSEKKALTHPSLSTLEHYKFCPDGSRPWEKFFTHDKSKGKSTEKE